MTAHFSLFYLIFYSVSLASRYLCRFCVDHLNMIYINLFHFFHEYNLSTHSNSPLQVVNISDSNGGEYKIAMNSAIEFGVLYNPNNDLKSAQVCILKHIT